MEPLIVTMLKDVADNPEKLLRYGYLRRDENTADSVRMVWFEKTFDSSDSQLRLVLQVEFELAIGDAPDVSYRENLDYCFNGVFLKVIDRQMDRLTNVCYDEESESPRLIDRFSINIWTLQDLERFSSGLGSPNVPEKRA